MFSQATMPNPLPRVERRALPGAAHRRSLRGARQYVEPDLVAGKLGAAEIEGLDSKLVHEAAAELLERSADPVERVSICWRC
jgi:hypothetical protein